MKLYDNKSFERGRLTSECNVPLKHILKTILFCQFIVLALSTKL